MFGACFGRGQSHVLLPALVGITLWFYMLILPLLGGELQGWPSRSLYGQLAGLRLIA